MPAVFRAPLFRPNAIFRHGGALLALIIMLGSVIFSSGSSALAEDRSLLRWSEGALSIAVEENTPTSARVTVAAAKGSLRAAFAVDNPSRVVLDIQGVRLRKGRALAVDAPALVRALRLGVHQELTRLVIDCDGTTPPSFKVESQTGRITVHLKAALVYADTAIQAVEESPPSVATLDVAPQTSTVAAQPSPSAISTLTPSIEFTPVVPTEAPHTTAPANPEQSPSAPNSDIGSAPVEITAMPIAVESPAPSPTPLATATATARPTRGTRLTPTPTTTPKIEQTEAASVQVTVPSNTTPIVKEVSFDFISTQRLPTIVIAASRRGEFKLTRGNDRSFELFLPGYSLLDPRLALPQFPTDEFIGITFVQPESTAQGVKIRIGVDHGIRLGAVWQDTRILINTR